MVPSRPVYQLRLQSNSSNINPVPSYLSRISLSPRLSIPPTTLLPFGTSHVCLRCLTPPDRLSYTSPPSRLSIWTGSGTAKSVTTED